MEYQMWRNRQYPQLLVRCSAKDGFERTNTKEREGWRFTYPPLQNEWDDLEPIEGTPPVAEADKEDEDREIFGETLDEPIPDDLWAMINSI